jgi:hypothetical protein
MTERLTDAEVDEMMKTIEATKPAKRWTSSKYPNKSERNRAKRIRRQMRKR